MIGASKWLNNLIVDESWVTNLTVPICLLTRLSDSSWGVSLIVDTSKYGNPPTSPILTLHLSRCKTYVAGFIDIRFVVSVEFLFHSLDISKAHL